LDSWVTLTTCPEQTRLLGRLLGEYAEAGQVILLSGPLGVGKTCFAQGVGDGLGVPSKAPVTSPSYGLMNIHPGRLLLYHFDLYRLTRIDDLGDLGYDEFAEGDGLTLVEWADRLTDALEACLSVEITRTDDWERRISFAALDAEGNHLVEQLRRGWQSTVGAGSKPPCVP
jgi:tRNA threonylcarbamoyladenosine biosynthesis protein TsaE